MTKLKDAPYNFYKFVDEDPNEPITDYHKFKDDPSTDEMLQTLKDLGFKVPSKELFRERIIRVYGYDIDDYRGDLFLLSNSAFPNIVNKKSRYIGNDYPDLLNYELYLLNNFVIYEDKSAFYQLMKDNYSELLNELIVVHNYYGDKDLNKRFLGDLSSKVALDMYLYNVIFSSKAIKIDFLNAIFVNGYEKEIIKNIQQNKKCHMPPDAMLAFLYEETISVGLTKYIEDRLNREYEYKYFLEDNGFFNLKILREYVYFGYKKKIYLNSADGYSNLRKKPNAQAEILATVSNDEHLYYLDEDEAGNWVKVNYTNSSNIVFEGYIHKSQIKK